MSIWTKKKISWKYIMIHHSLTRDSSTVSWQAIRHYHVAKLGWNDIGYHFGIELVNGQYEVLIGRMLNEDGAHCREAAMNRLAIGICFIGNFDEDNLPDHQRSLGVRLVKSLMAPFGIPADHVVRHHDFAPYKSCPGTRFPWAAFKNQLTWD